MVKRLLIYIIFLFGITGCYNYKELNDLAIVSGISIALVDGEYEVSVQVINPKNQQDTSNNNEDDFIIYKEKDSSIQKAIRKIAINCSKKIYLSHMDVLIIDESVAKKNLPYVLDFFMRNPTVRDEFYVLIGKSSDILSISTPLEDISSIGILNSLKINSKDLGYANMITFHELVSAYLDPYQELAVSSICVHGDKLQDSNIKDNEKRISTVVSGIAVFKSNYLIGYLEGTDALVYHILRNDNNHFLLTTNYDNNSFFVSEVLREATDISIDLSNYSVDIYIKGKAVLTENNTPCDLENSSTINAFQDSINDALQEMIANSISKVIYKYHTDIYGFHELLYHKNYKHVKNNWNDNVLKKLKINVHTNVKLVEKGNLNGGFIHE